MEFGVWAMLAFWASAIGGIVIAINWANSKSRNPAGREAIMRSLKQRLKSEEITQEEYEQKVRSLLKER